VSTGRVAGGGWRRWAAPASVVLLVCLTAAPGRAAFELRPLAPAGRACSGEALGLARGSVSAVHHPPRSGGPGILAGAFAYRPFGLNAVNVIALFARATRRDGSFGLTFSCTSVEAYTYSERVVALALGLSRGCVWVQPGVRVGGVSARGGLDAACIMADLLVYAYVLPALRVDFGAENAFASGLRLPGGAAPTTVSAGVGYAFSPSAACGLRLERENGLGISIATGLEWRMGCGCFLRLGSRTLPGEFSAGLGVRVKAVCIDISTTSNLDLGMTHEAGITFIRE
jgi:hypothetical protein